jgi:beta-lactamase regulating signal transducer with metallopeptidase domain/sporulation protein YlmC with PRC-barrel domain
MTHFAAWLAPELLRPLGLALLHFLWQGTALAALAGLAFALTRNAQARYVSGVTILALMVAAPLATFQFLRHRPASDAPTLAVPTHQPLAAPAAKAVAAPAALAGASAQPAQANRALVWLVELWFLGVLLFSLRTFGGILLVERLRRKSAAPLPRALLIRCHELQWTLGLERVVRYCESVHVAAPAVVGWFRPVVMLPVSVVTGLSEAQLRAVIAHELAHIKRFDAFLNLFQIAAESLLFYHPAVWWLSARIRAERENCCDDAAIAACGSPVDYARALTLMEEWRSVPALAMAVNRHPLAARVRRLLGLPASEPSFRTAGLSAGILCLAAAVVAGNAFFGVARTQAAPQTSPADTSSSSRSVILVQAQRSAQEKPAKAAPKPEPSPVLAQSPEPSPRQSYIDSLKAEGIDNVSLDDLIALKVQGVTAEYIRGIHSAGLKPSVEELIAMKVQGITGEYIRELAQAGVKTTIDELIGMKVQSITPDYVRQMEDLGLDTDSDKLIGMKVQGITPEYVKEMRAAVPNLKSDELIGMKVQGITPNYVRQMHDLGIKADADSLIGMNVQGITPEYIQAIRATGLNPDTDEFIGLKVQGVTADYIKSLQAAGLKLDVDEVIGAKVQGITPEFIEKARNHGLKDLDLEKLIALKHSGVLE